MRCGRAPPATARRSRTLIKLIPLTSTKKEVTFVCHKLLLFLSKPQAWYIITARSAVYIISPYGAVSHHASACISLRLDDMPQQVADDIQCDPLMICNGKPLICFRKCGIIAKRRFIYEIIQTCWTSGVGFNCKDKL